MKSIFFILTIFTSAAYAQQQFSGWNAYGGDAGGTRYSSLTQINAANVHDLKPAWTFRTGELDTYKGTKVIEKAAFEATPVLVDNTLFFSTPTCRVFAVDPVTGKQKWMYDPKLNLNDFYSEITTRGVSAWPSVNDKNNKKAKRRIFIGALDGRLIALDAASGKPVSTFGKNGAVDLRQGLGDD